jgi:hypothetical protein
MLLPYDFFPVDILNNQGEHIVHMLAMRPSLVQEITFAQKAVAGKDETIKHLMAQNVVAAFGSGNDINLYNYVRSCVEKMSSEKKPIDVPAHYGWQKDGTYVFAGRIYAANKTPIEVPMPGLENIVMNTQPTGSLETWRKVINLLVRRKLWDHLAIILLGAGAPLMRFTGLYGLTVHCASKDKCLWIQPYRADLALPQRKAAGESDDGTRSDDHGRSSGSDGEPTICRICLTPTKTIYDSAHRTTLTWRWNQGRRERNPELRRGHAHRCRCIFRWARWR